MNNSKNSQALSSSDLRLVTLRLVALSLVAPVVVALLLPASQGLLALLALTVPFLTMARLEKLAQEQGSQGSFGGRLSLPESA